MRRRGFNVFFLIVIFPLKKIFFLNVPKIREMYCKNVQMMIKTTIERFTQVQDILIFHTELRNHNRIVFEEMTSWTA